jgi:hypothetical protein
MGAAVLRSFGSGRPIDHQTGAGDEAALVGCDNAAINASALAEIIPAQCWHPEIGILI